MNFNHGKSKEKKSILIIMTVTILFIVAIITIHNASATIFFPFDYLVTQNSTTSMLINSTGQIIQSQTYNGDDSVLVNKAISLIQSSGSKYTVLLAGNLNAQTPINLNTRVDLIQKGTLNNYITNGSGMLRLSAYNIDIEADFLADQTAGKKGTAIEIQPNYTSGVAYADINVHYAQSFNKTMGWKLVAGKESWITASKINIYSDNANYGIYIPDTIGGGFGTLGGDDVNFLPERTQNTLIYLGTGSHSHSIIRMASDMGSDNLAPSGYVNKASNLGNTLIFGGYVNENKNIYSPNDAVFGVRQVRHVISTNLPNFYSVLNNTSNQIFQRFIDYASGSIINSAWTDRHITNKGTAVIDTTANGGMRLSTNSTSWSEEQLDFNNRTQYTNGNAVMIVVAKATNGAANTGNFEAGFIVDATKGTPGKNVAAVSVGNSFNRIELRTYDSAGVENDVASGTARDNNIHVYKLVSRSGAIDLYVDGSGPYTSASHLPTGTLQPFLYEVTGNGGGIQSANISYVEIYNTG